MTADALMCRASGMKTMAKKRFNLTDDGLADKMHMSVSKLRKGLYIQWEVSELLMLADLADCEVEIRFREKHR